MTRLQQFENEVSEITKSEIRKDMPTPILIDAEICFNPHSFYLFCEYSPVNIHKGLEKNWIDDNGYTICKKSESTILLICGNKDNGAWQKAKCYWLKLKQLTEKK